MYRQMTIFDWMPECQPEPPVGAWVRTHGQIIPHIMRKSYIGRKVCIDVSTENNEIYQVGILEDYIPYEGRMRSVIYTGKKQRQLVTHYPGVEIFECLPWNAYEERNRAIGRRG